MSIYTKVLVVLPIFHCVSGWWLCNQERRTATPIMFMTYLAFGSIIAPIIFFLNTRDWCSSKLNQAQVWLKGGWNDLGLDYICNCRLRCRLCPGDSLHAKHSKKSTPMGRTIRLRLADTDTICRHHRVYHMRFSLWIFIPEVVPPEL